MAFSKRSMSKDQRSGFDDRLARIRKGGSNTMGEVHIGPREEIRAGNKKAPKNTVRVKKKNNKHKEIGRGSALSLLILSFVFGAFSMFVGQAADFHLFQTGGLAPIDLSGTPVEPYLAQASLVFGGVLAILFAWTFRLTTILRLAAVAAGLFVMVEYHSDLVKQVPGVYTKFFSKAYVKSVRQNIPIEQVKV